MLYPAAHTAVPAHAHSRHLISEGSWRGHGTKKLVLAHLLCRLNLSVLEYAALKRKMNLVVETGNSLERDFIKTKHHKLENLGESPQES